MPFEKGHKGYKPKGSKAKKTLQWEALGEAIRNEHTEKFNQELAKLEGKDFIQAYSNVLEYFEPKKQRIEGDIDNELVIRVVRE